MPGLRFLNTRRSSFTSMLSRDKLAPHPVFVGIPHERDSMDFFKRPGSSHKRLSGKFSHASSGPEQPARMELVVESPPLVCHGNPGNSTGALFSGQLRVQVLDLSVVFTEFEVRLLSTTTFKKPVAQCHDCSKHVTELHKWNLCSEPTKYKQGEHLFPVSHLLPGNTPATTHASSLDIDYHIHATATTSMGEIVHFEHPLTVLRAIQPACDKRSLRLFPPTNISMGVTMPPVIHPIGEFNVNMQLTGITDNRQGWIWRWRIRKLSWRIEEREKLIVPTCPHHMQKVVADAKGIPHDVTRSIAEKEIKNSWKHDFNNDQIISEFSAAIDLNRKPVCDVEGPNELSITHAFVIEMVVTEEYAPINKPMSITVTGAARVLRASFNLVVTERAGLGVSWDEEQPPLYEDVPASPPTYAHMRDYDGPELDNDHIRLN